MLMDDGKGKSWLRVDERTLWVPEICYHLHLNSIEKKVNNE